MAVVAGLFDEQVQATRAMDILLQSDFKDIDTRVVEAGSNDSTESGGVFFPVLPNTGGSGSGQPGNPGLAGAAFAGADWMDLMDDVERAFYYEGMREGATLAMAKVDDERADDVRRIMRQNGARTYVED